MSNDLAPTAGNALAAMLSDTKRLNEIPIETVKELFAIDRQMRADAAREAFFAAFARAQGEMEPVRRTGKNTQTGSMFAKAEDVCRMLDPIATRHGFSRSLSTEDSQLADHMRFVLTLRHEGGHAERHTFDAPVDDKGPKGNPTKTRLQGMASTYTYIERHMLMKVWGVQTVADDDGNAGAGIGPSAERISPDQAIHLSDLIQESGADEGRFLRFFRVGKVADLPASRYREAVAKLEQRKARQ